MEDKIDCLLDMIPQESHFYYYFRGCWANGKEGSISDSNGHCVYRFYPLMKDSNGNRIESKIDYDDYVTNPVVATGIIGYWLHFRKNNDCLASYTTWTKEDERKNTLKIFNDYTEDKLKQYIEREQYSPSSWRRDLEKEFYTDFIIPNEEPLNKQSEALFEYITKDDRKLVEEVIEEYMKYLRKCRSDKGYQVKPELLVLRAVESQDNTKYEDLKDYEVNTILDKLEGEGFIRVAWIEGHRPEGTRILDKGRAYLKQLEEGEGVIDVASVDTTQPYPEELSTETSYQMTQSNDNSEHDQYVDDEEWDDSLDSVFHKKLKPQEIKKALEILTSATLSEDKRRFVYYKVFVFIRWIPTDIRGSKKKFLKWWNLHFNCNWIETDTLDPFKFRVDSRLMKSQPYEWNELDMDNANEYYVFAKTVKNTFTQTVINNVAQDGQDFNAGPLFDRGRFLKDTHKPINNGTTFFKS